MARWYNKVEETGMHSFNVIAATFYEHYDETLNFYHHRSSNAMAESFHAKSNCSELISGVLQTRNFFFSVWVIYTLIPTNFLLSHKNVVNWITKGYLTYVDKEKALDYLHHSERSISEALSNPRHEENEILNKPQSNSADVKNELFSATNIIKDFDNPNINTKTNSENDILLRRKKEETEIRDAAYKEAVEKGDVATAQKLLAEEAERKGYSTNSDYQGTSALNGAAPTGEGYYDTLEERKAAWDEEEYEGDWSLAHELVHGIKMGDLEHRISAMQMQRYDAMRREAAQGIRDVRAKLQAGEKNVKIKLYRSVPNSVKESQFRNGDWVTPSKAYAEDNAKVHAGYPGWENGYHIIEQEVPIENVWWYGNDLAEWGYHNGKESKRARIPLLCMWFEYRRY